MNLRLLGGLSATALAFLWCMAVPAVPPIRATLPTTLVARDSCPLAQQREVLASSLPDPLPPLPREPAGESSQVPKLTTVLRALAAESKSAPSEEALPPAPLPTIPADQLHGESAETRAQPESRVEKELEEEVRFRDYVIRVWFTSSEDAGDACAFEIERGGEQLYSTSMSSRFFVLREPDSDADEWPASVQREEQAAWVGRDVTGEGEPDVVVVGEDGGSNSPSTIHVFELGREFKQIAFIQAYEWHFEDLDGDEVPELTAEDNYGYWPCKHAIEPRVVLRFRDGAYQPAPDLMRRPASDFTGWRDVATRVFEESDWESEVPPFGRPPAALCGYVGDLVYAGQAELAQEFLDTAWPDSIPGKADAVVDLARAFAGSRFWDAVIAVNGW